MSFVCVENQVCLAIREGTKLRCRVRLYRNEHIRTYRMYGEKLKFSRDTVSISEWVPARELQANIRPGLDTHSTRERHKLDPDSTRTRPAHDARVLATLAVICTVTKVKMIARTYS